MNNLYIYPYKIGSQSAKALSEALEAPQIRHTNSKFEGSAKKTVINWGASKLSQQVLRSKVLNTVDIVRRVGNKLQFFEHQSSFGENTARLVPWTASKVEALTWLTNGNTVVARTVLTGHSGYGIIITEKGAETLPDAPLYTKYVPKDSEWRVHCAFGEVIDCQRKIRDPDREPTNWKVRSHDNGFIYIRNTDNPPSDVIDQALLSFKNSGLDFGAIDCLFNKKQQKTYILEINTAPGIQNTTVEVYKNAFLKKLTQGE